MVEEGQDTNFEINISSFNSKKVVVIMDGMPSASIPYSSIPMYLEQLLIEQKIVTSSGIDHSITLSRDGEEYYFSFDRLMRNAKPKYRLFPNDKVFIKKLNYKPETILIIGETGQQRTLPIDAFQRPTLSDAIFSVPVLNSITSDFSQIYVLRKKKDLFRAFHLDITNPTRVSLASKFEMRPDDIVFVATQPLSLYSRTLSQILGSTGLTLQARDTIRTEIGN